MSRIALVQTVHLLPGKAEEAITWFKGGEEIRKQWGMHQQLIMRKPYDPSVYMVIQIWESAEVYNRWKTSEERDKALEQGRRLRVREPSVTYELV